jgi:hypothetical protein
MDDEDRYAEPNIFDVIIREMRNDDDGYRQNAKFQWWYDESNDATKAIIDQTLLWLCGWSMATLIKKATTRPAVDADDRDRL